jgi:O-antigen/teichoic acid export membrane protein
VRAAEFELDPIPDTPPDAHLLDQRVQEGLRWSAIRQVITSTVGMGAVLLYARFLTPDALGAAALALLVYSGLYQLVRAPFSHTVIYFQEDTNAHTSAAFWMLMTFSTIATIVVLIAAPLFGQFYESPLAVGLTRIVTVVFWLLSAASIPAALLVKQMRFKVYERLLMMLELGNSVGWIALSYLGFGAWSLILPGLFVAPFWLAGVWITSGFRPMRRVSRAVYREVFRFVRSLWGSELLTFLMAKVDNMVVGRLGQRALGFYSFGEDQSTFIYLSVAGVIANVTLPVLAKLQHAMDEFRQRYLEMVRLTAVVSMPMHVGAIIVAEITLTLFFGDQWARAIPVLRAYLAFHVFDSLTLLSDAAMSASGRPHLRLRYNLFQLPFFVGGAVFAYEYWGTVIAIALTLAAIRSVAALCYLAYTWWVFKVDVWVGIRMIGPALLSSGLMGLAVYGTLLIAPPQPVLALMLIIVTGVAAYGGLILVLDRAGVIAVLRLSIELFVPSPVRPRLAAILRRLPLVRRVVPVLFKGTDHFDTEERRNGETGG